MLFSEPGQTPYDIRFTLFSIPVRIHPIFWVIAAIMGMNAGRISEVLIWVLAVFLAILLHEFGHALVMRFYGLRPWVVLHGMGGIACYDTSQLNYSRANTWIRQIAISVAGVTVGFLLVIILVGVFVALGHSFIMVAGINTDQVLRINRTGFDTWSHPGLDITGIYVAISGIKPHFLAELFNDLLYICLIWGVVNLLPVYPLDGGQISREILLRFNARDGIRRSLLLSMTTAAILAAFALATMYRSMKAAMDMGEPAGSPFRSASFYIAILFGYLAYSSYATLQAYSGQRPRW